MVVRACEALLLPCVLRVQSGTSQSAGIFDYLSSYQPSLRVQWCLDMVAAILVSHGVAVNVNSLGSEAPPPRSTLSLGGTDEFDATVLQALDSPDLPAKSAVRAPVSGNCHWGWLCPPAGGVRIVATC